MTQVHHIQEAVSVSADSAASRKMDKLVGYILLIGVLLSMGLITIGVLWHFARTGRFELAYSISGTNLYHFVISEFSEAFHLSVRPRLLVNLGIATLMMTPYIRVFASMVYFAFAERNGKYTVFTALVFTILTYSLFLR